ncbi:MAG TPA: FG-GAP-like repeat-containing protein [Ramlibacter sp.]|nr:FG-GAP-like repeat-containing protein [Ramlibacter sp.]
MAAEIADITLNPLPSSILLPGSRFTGTLVGPFLTGAAYTSFPVVFGASGDLTNDGFPEILITGWGGDDGHNDGIVVDSQIFLFSAGAAGTVMVDPMQVLGLASQNGTSNPRILDLDLNGLNDFLYLSFNEHPFATGISEAVMQVSPGVFVRKTLAGPNIGSHNSAVGDLNADGYPDLIAAGGIMSSGYFDPIFFNSGCILYLNDHDGTFTPLILHYTKPAAEIRQTGDSGPQIGAGSAAAIGDFDNDGKADVVISDCAVVPGGSNVFGRGDTWLVSNITLGAGEAYGTLTKLPDPYMEGKAEFAPFESFMGDQKSHDVKTAVLDINNDGLLDILVSSMIWDLDFGTRAGVLQVLLNKGNLQFEDVTDSSLYNFFLGKSSGHQLELIDVNGDGFLDIYMPETDSGAGTSSLDRTWANELLVSTGTGKFVQALWTQFHELTVAGGALLPPQYSADNLQDNPAYLYVMPDGTIGFVQKQQLYSPDGPTAAFFDFRADAPFSTGPQGSDAALQGAPGFSEYFYLTEYPQAAAAVQAGFYASGLAHFLAVGRDQGLYSFASNAHIHGSAAADIVQGREGNESLAGLAGNDRLNGHAGNDTLDGGAGLDTAVYAGLRSQYAVAGGAGHAAAVTDRVAGRDGADTLHDIERLQFADMHVAFDLDGNAGNAAKCIGAVFGRTLASNPLYVGVGIALLDQGMSYTQLAQSAIEYMLGASASHVDIVQLLFGNLVGAPPDAPTQAFLVSLLDDGAYSVGEFGVLAADHVMNQTAIGLAGLSESGLSYFPYLS